MNWLFNYIKLSLVASYMKYVLFIGTILLLDTLKCRFGCHSPNHFLPLRISETRQKKICLSVSTLLSIWIRVNGAKRVNDAPSTTFNHLKTTCSNYRKVIPTYEWLAWLCLFLSCYLFANDPEMTPTFIEDKHEFNLQHISLLVIIDVSRQATFYSDFML